MEKSGEKLFRGRRRQCLWRVSHPPPRSEGEASTRACKPKFPLSGDVFSILLVFYTAHGAELCDVAAWDFQSTVSHIAEFLHPLPSSPVPLGALAVPPCCSPPLAGPRGPLLPQGEAENAAPPCPRARLERARNGVPGKLLCDGGGEGQELGDSRKNKICTRGRAGAALCASFCVPHASEMEFRWVFPPGNAARGKGA